MARSVRAHWGLGGGRGVRAALRMKGVVLRGSCQLSSRAQFVPPGSTIGAETSRNKENRIKSHD